MKITSAVPVLCLLLLVFPAQPRVQAKQPAVPAGDVLLTTMEQELHRGQAELAKQDPAPYFTSYTVTDDDSLFVIGSQGGLLSSNRVHRRTANVSLRIGSPALDNTHDEERRSGLTFGQLPVRDDPDAIARVLWKLTYEQYRQAQQAYSNVKTKSAVRAKDEDDSADFSEEKPSTYSQEPSSAALPQQEAWESLARRYSSYFRAYPYLQESVAFLIAQKSRTYLVSTEGAKVVTEDTIFRVMIQAETLADDGM
jgi:TldD protein